MVVVFVVNAMLHIRLAGCHKFHRLQDYCCQVVVTFSECLSKMRIFHAHTFTYTTICIYVMCVQVQSMQKQKDKYFIAEIVVL